MNDLDKPTAQAARQCANWLVSCLEIGWPKDKLDLLENIWWKHHDYRGNLTVDEETSWR